MTTWKVGDPVRYRLPHSHLKKQPGLVQHGSTVVSTIQTVTPTGLIKTAAGHSFDAQGRFRGLTAHEKRFSPSAYHLEFWGPEQQAARRKSQLVNLLRQTNWRDLPMETLEAVHTLLYPDERALS